MKSIISLSLAGLSLQGIILGELKIQQPTFIAPTTGLVNQVNQIPVRSISPPHYRYNPLIQRYRPVNVIQTVPIMPQPINTFVTPIQPITQPIQTVVQPIVQPVQPIFQPVVPPIDNVVVVPQNQCRISGVYKQLCLKKDQLYSNEMTAINYNRKYECFDKAICAFKDNKCQWFQTKKFKRCIRRVQDEEDFSQLRS